MNVLQEILAWSIDRPIWQREALRRLIENANLSDDDVTELTNICKSAYGLADDQEKILLSQEHVPASSTSNEPVTLMSIFHHQGVNALAENQTLKLSPNLTVVYGDNGAGKTGYIRILKEACRARRKEQLLGNMTSGQTPLSPVVSIKYKIGNGTEFKEWPGSNDNSISRVSIFDTQSATVYLTEKTDVAFRPFGLDLFDKLVKACRAVKSNLDVEQRALNLSAASSIQSLMPEGTQAHKLLSNITSLTNPDVLLSIATLSDDEKNKIVLLENSLQDLRTNDPKQLIRQLELRVARLRILRDHLRSIESILSNHFLKNVFEIRRQGILKAEEAKQLHVLALPKTTLNGTGSDNWKQFWEAARTFSEEHAYPNQVFPVIDEGALCVLCQQTLNHDATLRLKEFQEFILSTVEQDLEKLRKEFVSLRKAIFDLKITTTEIDGIISELKIDHEDIAEKIVYSMKSNESRYNAVMNILTKKEEFSDDIPDILPTSDLAENITVNIGDRIKALREISAEDAEKRIHNELKELTARQILSKHIGVVLTEIEQKKKYAAYSLCLEQTSTQSITKKSSAVTREVVSQHLKESFKNELRRLNFNHAEVELKEDGGSDGILYHKLILTNAPGVNLHKVTSEGEQRCLSIAAFFAELSTADDCSGIVFDDPISSLDFRWRESVARRLVQEAKKRQVVVFTHDVVFLLHLKQIADELQVEQLDQHVQKLPKGAGVCIEELPWFALPVKRKIGFLKNEIQRVEKLFREGEINAYEKEATHLYGLLRSAWERALEEVLLGGLIERFRVNIQTQQIEKIADINLDECRTLDSAMTKCSKWIAGHDQASAARATVPEPDELKRDIDNLETWVQAIRKRRS